jgi:hypothetical protein
MFGFARTASARACASSSNKAVASSFVLTEKSIVLSIRRRMRL